MTKPLKKMAKVLLVLSLLFVGNVWHQGTSSAAISEQFWLNNLIELPSEAYDEEEAQRMIDRLLAIPDDVLETLVYRNVKIKLVNGSITDVPEYSYLKGVTPRGWEGTGKTWDDIPGAGGNPTVIRIGYSEMGMGHGSYNLELHETFHAIDDYVFDSVSQTQAFLEIFYKEAGQLFDDGYGDAYPEEYFAEAACMYLLGGTTRELVRTLAPETYAFLEKLLYEYEAVPYSIAEMRGHWAKADMERLRSLGIISGFADGTIRPNENVTREQFVKMLLESLGMPQVRKTEAVFRDVPASRWSAPYIQIAVAKGIIEPEEYAGGNFEPAKVLTRAEMAVMLARALELEPNESALDFADSDAIKQHRGWIGAAVHSGLINGTPQNLFQPDGVVTRAQAAAVLNRMLDMEAP